MTKIEVAAIAGTVRKVVTQADTGPQSERATVRGAMFVHAHDLASAIGPHVKNFDRIKFIRECGL